MDIANRVEEIIREIYNGEMILNFGDFDLIVKMVDSSQKLISYIEKLLSASILIGEDKSE